MKLNEFKTGLVFGLIANLFLFVYLVSLVTLDPQPASTEPLSQTSWIIFLVYFFGQPILMGLLGKLLLKGGK